MDDEIISEYKDILKNFDEAIPCGRRVMRNRAILNYVLSLHEMIYFTVRDGAVPRNAELGMAMFSKTVASHLPKATDALQKSIMNERQPFAIIGEDGDEHEDDFTSSVKETIIGFIRDIDKLSAEAAWRRTSECASKLDSLLGEEFIRQSHASWT